MVATFTTTGTAVKIGSVVQVSGVTVNNFTKPVIYTVYAADGTSQNYTVTVNVSPGNDKDLTSFSWGRTIGTISGNSVSIMAPVGADITHLVTKFTSTGTAVSVNGVAQQSEVTANDFTNPVTYVVTALNGTTQAYTVTATPSQGTMSTLAGSLSGPFAYPHFLAIDQRGVVYVSDYSHNEIKAIGLDGAVSVAYRSDSSNLSAPTGISLDPGTGTLWVADSAGAVSLVELPVSGGYSNQSVSLNAPMEIAQYDTDAVLIADSGSNSIIDTDGSYGSVIASGLHQPYGIAVNASKTIFIADTYSHHILQMHLANPMPSPTVFAGSASTTGSQDGTGTAASFDLPTGLAVDPAGNLWVTDMGNNTVRKITPAGVVTTIVSSDAGLDTPIGVAVDPWGEVFVCDMNNGAIKMIQ